MQKEVEELLRKARLVQEGQFANDVIGKIFECIVIDDNAFSKVIMGRIEGFCADNEHIIVISQALQPVRERAQLSLCFFADSEEWELVEYKPDGSANSFTVKMEFWGKE